MLCALYCAIYTCDFHCQGNPGIFHILQCIIQFSGPSEPRDVSAAAINSTAVNVTWSEPEYLNGVLESYSVTGTLRHVVIQ